MDSGAEILVLTLTYVALAALAALGILVLGRWAPSWFPLQRLKPARWTGAFLFFSILLWQVLLPGLVVTLLHESGFFFRIFGRHISQFREVNLLGPPLALVFFAISLAILQTAGRTYPSQVGLSLIRWPANVRLGLAAFILITPVAEGAFLLARLVTPATPHPLEQIATESLHWIEWIFIGLNAVVVAPLVEEWLFRGLLQAWLRGAPPVGHLAIAMLALALGCEPVFKAWNEASKNEEGRAWLEDNGYDPDDEDNRAALELTPEQRIPWEAGILTITVVGVYVGGVVRIWRPVLEKGLGYFVEKPVVPEASAPLTPDQLEGQAPVVVPHGPRWQAFQQANARWAILGSAMLFSFMHNAWPSPVGLLPLALTLGWLAYRTQSLLPGIVVHVLFNTIALVTLVVTTGQPAEKGNAATTARRSPAASIDKTVPGAWLPRRT